MRLCLESGSHLQTATGRTQGEFRELLVICICGTDCQLWPTCLKMNDTVDISRYIIIEALFFLNHVLIEYACGVTPSDRYDFGVFRLRKGNNNREVESFTSADLSPKSNSFIRTIV